MKLFVYFDGCSKGNPGRSGAGCVIYNRNPDTDENVKEVWYASKYVGDRCTNNCAEYESLIMALERLVLIASEHDTVVIRGDSQLVIKQMRGEYKVKHPKMIPLYANAQAFLQKLRASSVTFEHVMRGKNQRADALANEAVIQN